MKQLICTTLICFLSLCSLARADKSTDRPNILFIFSDDHATAAISAYNGEINQTPNIDRIAKEGAIFRNSFCANSICGPSRACILSGKHSHVNGFLRNGDKFDGSQDIFSKRLQKTGYRTAIIGKWHLSSDPTGFDHWEVLPGQGHYYNPDFLTVDGKHREQGYVTDLITEKAIDWIDSKQDSDQSFLLMCQHKAPHRNWSPAPRHLSMYDDSDISEPDSLFDNYAGRTERLKENEMSLANHFTWGHDSKLKGDNLAPQYFSTGRGNREYERMTDQQRMQWDAHYEPLNKAFVKKLTAGGLSDEEILRWKYQRYIKDYLRCVAAVDESIGQLLQHLDDTGLADNTIVIYSSDQGFYLGEHGWYDKRWMFEQSLEMPFVIRWPGRINPGSQPEALIQNIDYAPTFLEIAGAEVPEAIQGRSLLPVLSGDCDTPADWRKNIYYAYYEDGATHNVAAHEGVRTDRHKLMRFAQGNEYQLFDLKEDPDEMTSVHGHTEYADVFDAMKQRLEDAKDYYDVNTAAIPASRNGEERWRKRNVELNKRARKSKDANLVFLGDSITQGWEGAGKQVWQDHYGDNKAINLGIGGDRTEHVLWRLDHGNLGEINPDLITILIGTNNTGHLMQNPEEVAEGIGMIVSKLRERLPDSKLLLQAIFPRGSGPNDSARVNNDSINRIIRHFATDPMVHWIDISDRFLVEDGTIDPELSHDQLHLTTKGYEVWAEAIESTIKQLMKE